MIKPGDVCQHKTLRGVVCDVTAVKGLWVEFKTRDKEGLRWLEHDVFEQTHTVVRNSHVLLACWTDVEQLRQQAVNEGIAVPREFL